MVVHAERALHGHERPESAVAAFELLHDEAVGDVVETGAAVALEVRAEHAELRHLGDQVVRKRPLAVVVLDDGSTRSPTKPSTESRTRISSSLKRPSISRKSTPSNFC
jgi:hypothetical protein